jgi:hypothetical protein
MGAAGDTHIAAARTEAVVRTAPVAVADRISARGGRAAAGSFLAEAVAALADLAAVDHRVVRRWRDRAVRDPLAVGHTEAAHTVAATGARQTAATAEVLDPATVTAATTVVLAPTAHRAQVAVLAAPMVVLGRAVQGIRTRTRGTQATGARRETMEVRRIVAILA